MQRISEVSINKQTNHSPINKSKGLMAPASLKPQTYHNQKKIEREENHSIDFDSLDIEDFFFPKKPSNSNNSSLLVEPSPLAKNRGSHFNNENGNFTLRLHHIQKSEEKIIPSTQETFTTLNKNVSGLFNDRNNYQKFKADEVEDLFQNILAEKREKKKLTTIKEVTDSFSSSNRFSFFPGSIKENESPEVIFSFQRENQEDEDLRLSRFARARVLLRESFYSSSEETEEEEESIDEDDDSVSMFEGVLEDIQMDIQSNESPVLESSIELEILMNGLNNNILQDSSESEVDEVKHDKSFNCCFSLFTSKDLESNTDERNIDNRSEVEFIRFSHPFKKDKKYGSLNNFDDYEKKNSKINEIRNFRRSSSMTDLQVPCGVKIKKKGSFEQNEQKKREEKICESEKCLICQKKLKDDVFLTCYDMCEHFFHEECIMDSVMDKWVSKGCKNNIYLACPKCVGVEKWRKNFEQL